MIYKEFSNSFYSQNYIKHYLTQKFSKVTLSCIDICLVLFVFQSAFLLSLVVVIDLYLLVDMIYLIGDYSSVWLTHQAHIIPSSDA